jgi:membrane protease YdiL (CAAX protease family)
VPPPASPTPPSPWATRRGLVATWALAIGGIGLARVLAQVDPTGLLGANLGGVAAVLFIVLPDRWLAARGEGWDRHGAPFHGLLDRRTWREAGRGLLAGVAVSAVVLPIFLAGFWYFVRALPEHPAGLLGALVPYAGTPHPAFRLPERFPLLVLLQVAVVALPEELFYRGWLQTAWARTAPERGVRVLGARLGAGFLWTQLLFAVGHLVTLQPWRIATFFPGLLFGWVRERTGSIAAPVVVHALSNLFIATVERSFYG